MKIKEMEELSGMTRANIRFYEKEGLLFPQRNSNGYRDYTEEDVETLKGIRMPRFSCFTGESKKTQITFQDFTFSEVGITVKAAFQCQNCQLRHMPFL